MDKISLKVAAKINLNLCITGIYPDGYHKLDMLLSSIDIYDTITVLRRNDNFINCYLGSKKSNEKNTACKAAAAVVAAFGTNGADIYIKKGIPFSAGLGGSSADAAGVLYAFNELYNLGGLKNLETIALAIGSDVPYMMYGGLALVSGRGEEIKKIPSKINLKLLVVKGKDGISTKNVYGQYDKLNIKLSSAQAYSGGTFEALDFELVNDLQQPAVSLCPEIENNISLLKTYTSKVLMTGSGSAVYGIFSNKEVLRKAYYEIKNKVYYCKIANTISQGIKVVETS